MTCCLNHVMICMREAVLNGVYTDQQIGTYLAVLQSAEYSGGL